MTNYDEAPLPSDDDMPADVMDAPDADMINDDRYDDGRAGVASDATIDEDGARVRPADTEEVIGAGAPGPQGQIKDPEQWVTGDQPMTDAQKGYLDSLAKQAGEQLPADLTKAEASEHIDRLQQETGRGNANS